MSGIESYRIRLNWSTATVPIAAVVATMLILLPSVVLGGTSRAGVGEPTSAGLVVAFSSATLTAPYRGTTHTTSDTLIPLLSDQCSKTNLTRSSAWYASTGSGGWDEKASARGGTTCSGANSTYHPPAQADSQISIAVPLGSPSTTGTYSVAATWIVNFTAKWSSSHSACPAPIMIKGAGAQSCEESASFSMSVDYPLLVDLTSGLVAYSYTGFNYQNSSYVIHDVTCSNYSSYQSCTTNIGHSRGPSGSVTVSHPWHSYWNSTSMNSSHQYALEFTFHGSVSTYLYSYPQTWTGNPTASLNVATRGNGLFLNSITIT